jgi:Fe-S oxidoreductase
MEEKEATTGRPDGDHEIEGFDAIEAARAAILDAASRCRNCNYCFTICPVFQSTRGFMSQTPSGILQSLNYALRWDLISGKERETLRDIVYACTTCNGCVIRCKSKATGIKIREAIEQGRKILRDMMIGPLPQQRKPLRDIYTYGNPYGGKPAERLDWLGEMKVKRLPADTAPVLLYVGCTTAYDPLLKDVGRGIVDVLTGLNVDFGVVENEVCCGDPALRMGDDAVFAEMVERNLVSFRAAAVQRIVTLSPHCYNTFLHDYPDFTREWAVEHYTEFLLRTIREQGRELTRAFPRVVTYHDPCYLGKHNKIYSAPRELLRLVPGLKLVEMKSNMDDSLCCGGGGGRMYAEVEEERRLSRIRVPEALDAGAEVIATACPWCFTMLDGAVKDLQVTDKIQVMDIAQILRQAIL